VGGWGPGGGGGGGPGVQIRRCWRRPECGAAVRGAIWLVGRRYQTGCGTEVRGCGPGVAADAMLGLGVQTQVGVGVPGVEDWEWQCGAGYLWGLWHRRGASGQDAPPQNDVISVFLAMEHLTQSFPK
jgi:hypothetical protein